MDMTRLVADSSELAGRLKQASEDKQRQAAIAACHFAQSHANLRNPLFLEAFRRLQNRESFLPHEKSQVATLVTQLDDQYFELYKAAEAKREAEEDASVETKKYSERFTQARAANCLFFAMEEDPFAASSGAIVEAMATTDKASELFDIIESILAQVDES